MNFVGKERLTNELNNGPVKLMNRREFADFCYETITDRLTPFEVVDFLNDGTTILQNMDSPLRSFVAQNLYRRMEEGVRQQTSKFIESSRYADRYASLFDTASRLEPWLNGDSHTYVSSALARNQINVVSRITQQVAQDNAHPLAGLSPSELAHYVKLSELEALDEMDLEEASGKARSKYVGINGLANELYGVETNYNGDYSVFIERVCKLVQLKKASKEDKAVNPEPEVLIPTEVEQVAPGQVTVKVNVDVDKLENIEASSFEESMTQEDEYIDLISVETTHQNAIAELNEVNLELNNERDFRYRRPEDQNGLKEKRLKSSRDYLKSKRILNSLGMHTQNPNTNISAFIDSFSIQENNVEQLPMSMVESIEPIEEEALPSIEVKTNRSTVGLMDGILGLFNKSTLKNLWDYGFNLASSASILMGIFLMGGFSVNKANEYKEDMVKKGTWELFLDEPVRYPLRTASYDLNERLNNYYAWDKIIDEYGFGPDIIERCKDSTNPLRIIDSKGRKRIVYCTKPYETPGDIVNAVNDNLYSSKLDVFEATERLFPEMSINDQMLGGTIIIIDPDDIDKIMSTENQ